MPIEAWRRTRSAFRSLTLKLVGLGAIFFALPIILYALFQSADRQTRDLVIRNLKDHSWMIAQALSPVLDASGAMPGKALNAELEKYSERGTVLRLMLQPASGNPDQKFYYIASSSPAAVARGLGGELESLSAHGVLRRLTESCAWDSPLDIRYRQADGKEEVLTSVIPIKSRWGCWLLISVHDTAEFVDSSLGRPYWKTREMRIAAISYLAFAVLAGLVWFSVWRSLLHFRQVTRDMREGGVVNRSFAGSRDVAPEFTSVAKDFDRLVHDLRRVAQDIREAAEDNAHSFKAPLGVITSALEPIKRGVGEVDAGARRAIGLIDSSLNRLRELVNSAQHLDNARADLIEAPSLYVDFAAVIGDVLQRHSQAARDHGVQVVRDIDRDIRIYANKGALDLIVENIVDNAISFSPTGGKIKVTLARDWDGVRFRVDDDGPGIDPADMPRIFERHYSVRHHQAPEASHVNGAKLPDHAGLGLWIVRRNVESLGGTVRAFNREQRGLAIEVLLRQGE